MASIEGLSMDSYTCSAAAKGGHWDIVAWAVQNGVSMKREIHLIIYGCFNLCEFAASKDRWDIVQLALSNGCSCSEDIQLGLLNQQSSIVQ